MSTSLDIVRASKNLSYGHTEEWTVSTKNYINTLIYAGIRKHEMMDLKEQDVNDYENVRYTQKEL